MKNINKFRLMMLLSACIVVAISCAKNNDNRDMEENGTRREVLSGHHGIEKGENTHESLQSATYIMRLEDTTLTLYEIADGKENAVAIVNIDTSYYPSDDIKELNKGVVAYSKEEGFARLENYTN